MNRLAQRVVVSAVVAGVITGIAGIAGSILADPFILGKEALAVAVDGLGERAIAVIFTRIKIFIYADELITVQIFIIVLKGQYCSVSRSIALCMQFIVVIRRIVVKMELNRVRNILGRIGKGQTVLSDQPFR